MKRNNSRGSFITPAFPSAIAKSISALPALPWPLLSVMGSTVGQSGCVGQAVFLKYELLWVSHYCMGLSFLIFIIGIMYE